MAQITASDHLLITTDFGDVAICRCAARLWSRDQQGGPATAEQAFAEHLRAQGASTHT